ncbi:Uncharacterized protein TPAR_04436 [Tolypocladium paradoxum]|uniref:aldehyde dehydrogenase (NAD(+)) n=1 Tax=Tolypocladium paradoxum TaxID=94208 RepID=A0A2S4KYV9_9HYPO|nr:Uncharacterized protein TPAR_04436 [Tolypocladium paradoxum]
MGLVVFDTFANVVDGKLVSTASTRHGINPATLEPLPPVPVSTRETVHDAVAAAKLAASGWAETPLNERQQRVVQFADALASQAGDFAKMLTLEQGKPLSAARDEVAQAVRVLKGVANLTLPEQLIEDTERRRVMTRYVPVGVCVGIVPWNFPIYLATVKLGPALVAGNPIIMKPSPFTPYCGLKLVELAQRFFPPGVVQVLSGDDNLGPWLTADPGVDKVSFTGSTATGIKVMQSCAQTLKRVTLELGGNDPAIICSDVDIATVAPKVAHLALYNSGQVCVAIKRVYVHSSIYKDFVAAMVRHIKSLVVGDGMDAASVLGPVQNVMQYQKLKNMVASIKSDNLNVSAGDIEGAFPDRKGYFMNPIVVDNPPDDSEIVSEEPFGPVFPVMQWDTEEEVIRRANSTSAGLGASVWSNDSSQASRIANQLQAGNVWINCHQEIQPNASFGGHKQSGIGSELGLEGLKAYCNVQTVYHDKGGSCRL